MSILYNPSHSCITTDRGPVEERTVRYLTLVWAEVQHPGLETQAIRLAGLAVDDRGPVSFGLIGLDGVCGLLADGYHYS